ncbi:TolC family protein, partial [bacterium]|nr:TolC family protein [candidate division CSSED10-310 bacterium]
MKRSDVNHFILGILMVTSLTSTVIPGVDGAGTELLDVYNFKPQNSEKIADDIHNESQVTITGGLSLEDAVRLALRFNRSLQSMIEEKAIARGQIVEAYGYVTPVIQLDGSYTRLDEVSSFQLEDGVVNLGYLDNYSATFQVVQPVFHGGALSAGIRAAKLYRTLTDRSIGTMVQEIVFQTVKAYYDVVLAEKQLDVETMHVELAEKHLQDVLTKQKYGVASTFNVLRAEVELSNARALLLSYQNSLHQARHNLFKTVGVSQRSEVALTDTLAHRPLVISEQAALTKAMGNRPDLNSAALTVELQKEAWTASKSAYWPQVDAFYRYTLAKPDPKISTINDWGETWQA